ncbi:uncharacterized protein LOC126893729 [Daktulosphaira vitifoliae]|uniref:uncharacterized protein LOC126893729 n=1 Tax=Daktulosphaira vitifoliae TaxID=58002 RepID=UPI0021AAAD35|nr:uncharacterized protein LOC126893729 [Daktulosphaira vitifoliae]
MFSEEDADVISSQDENDDDSSWELNEEDKSSSDDDEEDNDKLIKDEQIVSKLVRDVISGKSFDSNTSSLLKNCSYSILMYNKDIKEITPIQFEEMVMEKAALAIVNNSELGRQLFEAKAINKEQQFWKIKFENLQKQTSSIRKQLEKMKRKPYKKELNVRSVGTQLNWPNIDENNVQNTS